MEKRQRPGGRAARVRHAVLTAARDLYVSGETLPTLTDIAAKAGVQRTTLYRRWGNSEAVLLEAVGESIQKAIPLPNTGSLRKDLMKFARAAHEYHRSEGGRSFVAMALGAPDQVKQKYWHDRYAALQQIFENAVRRKEIAPQADWSFYLDLFIAPWYFCVWGKAGQWPLDAAEQTISLICSALLRSPGRTIRKEQS
jgi:AcrR family transcriptional regulator